MKEFKFSITDISELHGVAKEILQLSADRKVFLIEGEMGAGKTTLIKEICGQLGSKDNFSSPTFSIVNEYKVQSANPDSVIYHIDLYRIRSLNEALDAGIGEYINGDNYCFIEWPELIRGLLPEKIVKIDMKNEKNIREIVIFIE